MRKLATILIGGLLMAWMAYLSWPATADMPARSMPSEAIVPVKLQPSQPVAAPSYEAFEPSNKSAQQAV